MKMTFDFAVLLLFASTVFAAGSIVPSPLKCFDFKQIKDPSLCNTVTTCEPYEMCYVNNMYNATNYSMGCAEEHPCIETTGFQIQNSYLYNPGTVVGKRQSGLVICSLCCGDSLCNNKQCFALINSLRELWNSGHLDLASLSYKQ